MSIPRDFKQEVFQYVRQAIAERIEMLQQGLSDLADSLANETKSSAGDKYETARAMLHIEQDTIRKQLAESMTQKAVMDRIVVDNHADHIIPGSLVAIAEDYYFLSVALGKLVIRGKMVFALSARSPLGGRLMNSRVGDKIVINSAECVINDFR